MSNATKYEAITVTTAAKSLNPPTGGCTKFLITAEGAASSGARWRGDGTAPTATTGQYLLPGKDYILDLAASNFQVIQDTAASTTMVLHVHYLLD